MEEAFANSLQQSIVALMLEGQYKACFKLCIHKPGAEFSAGEKQCVAMCQDRYQEVFEKTFFKQYQEFIKTMEEQAHKEDLNSYK